MPMPDLPPLPDGLLERLNEQRGGLNELIGLRFTHASYETLEAEVPITPSLYQPYGLVHGGVYASIIESVASIAGLINCMHAGKGIVGLENTTSFLRATREGTLRARATPLVRGRNTQVWEVIIKNDEGKVAATGRVRLLAVDGDFDLKGQKMGSLTNE